VLQWSSTTTKCTCGHLASEEVHPLTRHEIFEGSVDYIRPCRVQICKCKDLEIDTTGKAKPL
jgi:hypothetical protein